MPWPESTPTIVAEALAVVPDPLQTTLVPPPRAPAAAVVRALARSLAPGESAEVPPPWLRRDQIPTFRRVAYAVDRFRGAVLADPVGSGKTYVALAVAQSRCRDTAVVCIVPPALTTQWRRVTGTLGIPACVWSHARVSRGALPESAGPLVLIDESHHFRNRTIRRYEHLAPWLIGRCAILITATPVVNRLTDLAHQLRLVVRDDALVDLGLQSIGQVLRFGHAHPALEHLVIRGAERAEARPSPKHALVRSHRASRDLDPLLEMVAGLSHSAKPAVQGLIRTVFWRAASSSPAALLGCAHRYRRLLEHARDAAACGRPLSRSALRWFTAGSEDQLVLWPLLTTGEGSTDLDLADLPKVDALIAAVQPLAGAPDSKCRTLRMILADGLMTLVFTTSQDTVSYLRRHLNTTDLAWCSGRSAGIGHTPLPRSVVLEWFRPITRRTVAGAKGPHVLVSTDVTAEGLDLHAAGRVVHYDLPWTTVRLTQRNGRVVRFGSSHRKVEIISFPLPDSLEARLRQHALLADKARLPTRLGLSGDPAESWRWRTDLPQLLGPGHASRGCARVCCPPRGLLGGFTVYGHRVDGSTARIVRLSSSVVWVAHRGRTTADPAVITERLVSAAAARQDTVKTESIQAAVTRLAPAIRREMRRLRRGRWLGRPLSGEQRKVIQRLHVLAQQFAQRRNAAGLEFVDDALRFVRGGHTAGEEAIISDLAQRPAHELLRHAAELPKAEPPLDALEARITGLILFEPSRSVS